MDNQPLVYPLAVLDWDVNPNNPPLALIQWSNTFPEDATWELASDTKDFYPNFHLEDKVFAEEERDIMDLSEARDDNDEDGIDDAIPQIWAKLN